jgi:hypothetical protein
MIAASTTEPRVHRHHRDLDGEREQERDEDPVLLVHRERQLLERLDAEVRRAQVHVDERDEHEHGAEERVQEELQRGVDAPWTAPHADDEEHRDEHRFPEEIEQQAVQRGEHADHQAFHDEEGGVVLRGALLDHRPGGNHDRDRDERGEQDQRQRDAVDAQVVSGMERGDPWHALDELERGGRRVEIEIERDRHPERRERGRERGPAADPDVLLAEQQHDDAARDRQPRQDR